MPSSRPLNNRCQHVKGGLTFLIHKNGEARQDLMEHFVIVQPHLQENNASFVLLDEKERKKERKKLIQHC